jgi:hypothetical protein
MLERPVISLIICLYNANFWSGLVAWIRKTIVEDWKLGDEKLLDLFKIVNNEDEILKDIFGKE